VTDSGVETELKIPVADLAQVRSRLADRGATLTSDNQREVNLLLDTADRELASRGSVLRLRRYGARRVLTFKGPATYEGPIKVRAEHELEIGDFETILAVFDALGFSGVARYEKDREVWRIEGVEVVLDHTPMGDFVEVEGPSSELESVALSLGLDPTDAVRGSYLSLWSEFRKRHPERELPPDMVFER
jgi:adenylate cyclase class 2